MRPRKFIDSFNLDLKKLILGLAAFSVFSLFVVSLVVSYYVQKKKLIQNSLAVNLEYAEKIADGTNSHFMIMQRELAYSAKILGENFNHPDVLQDEVHRLKYQSNYFNNVLIGDTQGHFISYAPKNLKINKNTVNRTLGVNLSLQRKVPVITSPYYSVTGHLVIFMSCPIFDDQKKYLGFVGASIYLKQDNILNQMFANKYDYKNSYMYVMDSSKRIIFHPNAARIGKIVKNNTGLNTIIHNETGKIRLVNSLGIDNLAGFARIPATQWIVVSEQPTHELLAQANKIIYKLIFGMSLFYIIIFLIIGRIAYLISNPLSDLAKMASNLNNPEIDEKIKQVEPWFVEVLKFKISLLLSSQYFKETISKLNYDVNTDPLTGLYNRRGMDLFIDDLMKTNTEFSVIFIDIDHFKKINDSFGHDQGDIVLKELAAFIKSSFRSDDVCCRIGGEEFVVLCPIFDTDFSYSLAEDLRKNLESKQMEAIGSITVSIGIAYWPLSAKEVEAVFKIADENLYRAKNEGRNCIRM
ncbi:sensor domain-containing diguanylate cyclase [Acinetobacter sp. MB5]|uniref:sensor domain-containing diguanylate cyclase n=1 Tax=Acinetobacter sp. MB5 TaxID=2069438 RepID=UPI000DD0C75E|nr:sensor domain-containing diguanylate cyclase [Acinetobacter sp. MB5]